MSYLITITAVSFGYERVPHCVGRPIEKDTIQTQTWIDDCDLRSKSETQIEEIAKAFLHEKSERGRARGARPPLGTFFLLLYINDDDDNDDDDNDDDDGSIRRSKEEETLPCGGRELRTRVEGKFEIPKSVFSLYHVRDDPIPPRVRGQCSMRVEKEEAAIVSIAIGINLSGRSVDRSVNYYLARQRPSECDRDRENPTEIPLVSCASSSEKPRGFSRS